MSKVFKFFLAVLIIVVVSLGWISQGMSQTDDNSVNFRYFDDECVPKVEGLSLKQVFSSTYSPDQGAQLLCVYSESEDFTDLRDQLRTRYKLTYTGKYRVFSFADNQAAQNYFQKYQEDLVAGGYVLFNVSQEEFWAQGKYYGQEDKENPHRDFKIIRLNKISVVEGSYDIKYFTNRYFKLEASLSDAQVEEIIKEIKNSISQPQSEQVYLFLDQAKNAALKKMEELDKRGIIKENLKQWKEKIKTTNMELEKRNNVWSWFVCLIFDGLHLPLEFLEKIGVGNPFNECAYVLYSDLASAKRLDVTPSSFEQYLNEPQKIQKTCIKNKVLVEYMPFVSDWNQRQIEFEPGLKKICPKHCLQKENDILCE